MTRINSGVSKWQEFYNSIKADHWPECELESEFDLLPDNIKQECVTDFGYVPGIFSLDKQLEDNQAFCVLPFIHLYINERSQVAPCCQASNIKSYDSSFDFYTDSDFEKIRLSMKNNQRVYYCNACYTVEDNGGESSRIRNTRDWAVKLKTTNIEDIEKRLRYYDIRNDNLCNLACRTCRPASSTQLEKEYKKLNWPIEANINKYSLADMIDYTNVEQVYVAGGEPTIMPEFTKFLEKAIDSNRTDIALTIITNATNLNKNILQLLEQFKNISFTLSLDGFDETNRYIRWPSDWPTIEKNIVKLKKLTSNISVNTTVSIYNIARLNELVAFLEHALPDPPTILLNQASGAMYSPFNFPNKELAVAQLDQLTKTQSYHRDQYFANKVDYFINMISKSSTNIQDLRQFFKYNDALDQLRGIKLADYIPELEQCRNLITKPT